MGDTDVALARLLERGRRRAASIDPHHVALWDALGRATEGGKRFRPALLLAAHDACGGTAHAAAAEVGAAVELLHTAFVVHDDVIDGDHVRRGRPNVSGTFHAAAARDGADPVGATGYALTAGVLAGDLALAAALRAVACCGADAQTVSRLLDLFDHALHVTAAGELADVRLALGTSDATLDESLSMEAHKTGVYSFSLPLQAGAVLAGADESTVAQLDLAGRAMGVAFQLVDDLLGVFGDPAVSGKSVTGDLRTRKQTPLVVHARTTAHWTRISGFLGRELCTGELDEVRGLFEDCGSRRFVEELAQGHWERAHRALHGVGIPADVLHDVSGWAPWPSPTRPDGVAA